MISEPRRQDGIRGRPFDGPALRTRRSGGRSDSFGLSDSSGARVPADKQGAASLAVGRSAPWKESTASATPGLRASVFLLALLPSAGCLGPEAIRSTRLAYNDAYQKTNDEQILLKLVRLRYADSPILIDLPTITGQFEAAALGGSNSPVSGAVDPGISSFGIGQPALRDSPSLSLHPREGHEIAETLANALNAEDLRVISPGADMRLFLLMAVNDVNDIPNAPLATSLDPRIPQDNCRFRDLVELLSRSRSGAPSS